MKESRRTGLIETDAPHMGLWVNWDGKSKVTVTGCTKNPLGKEANVLYGKDIFPLTCFYYVDSNELSGEIGLLPMVPTMPVLFIHDNRLAQLFEEARYYRGIFTSVNGVVFVKFVKRHHGTVLNDANLVRPEPPWIVRVKRGLKKAIFRR